MTPPERFNCGDQRLPAWHDRARVAAELLAQHLPRSTSPLSLADVGCGDCKLRDALRAARVVVDYAGYDLHPQHADVTTFDVARESLPRPHDVAVVLGVVEYLHDLDTVIRRLFAAATWVLASHVVRDRAQYTAARQRELGWVNHLDSDAFVALLERAGGRVVDRRWTGNGRTLLVLATRHPAA